MNTLFNLKLTEIELEELEFAVKVMLISYQGQEPFGVHEIRRLKALQEILKKINKEIIL